MGGGNKSLVTMAALAVTACTADDGNLNIRPIADPLAAASKRGSPMIVEGRRALALGNVGTALEAFRKALRDQPDSIEALAGIAACYERMGRYDLSRVNYEAALALAPNNAILLNSFAASLQLQGRFAEANALRAEAAAAEAADVAVAVRMAQADISPVVPARQTSPEPPAVKPAQAQSSAPIIDVARAERAPVPERRVVHREVVGNTEWKFEMPPAAPPAKTASVTVSLPPAQPVTAPEKTALAEATPPLPAPLAPVPVKAPGTDAVMAREPEPRRSQPRLERLSMGEVALLTSNGPAWRTEVVARTQQSTTARFVPLKDAPPVRQAARFVPLKAAMAASSRPNIRLLNAARTQGLAARTRSTLVGRGWRKIEIGDAAQVRARSIVLYPNGGQALGKRLAAQFGFASALNRDSDEVLVLLGRDAPSMSIRRARA